MRSRFVTSLGWFAFAGSFLGLLSGAGQLAIYKMFSGNPELLRAAEAALEMSFQEKFGAPWPGVDIRGMLLRNGSSSALVGLLGVIVGIALLRRKYWARLASIYLIAGITLVMVVSVFRTPFQTGVPLYWAGLGLTVVTLILHVGIIMKLRSPEIQAEFRR
ncbi:hypothetical protein EBZ37_08120 [bacterium]|nr:hypothetical protein [bacterium]